MVYTPAGIGGQNRVKLPFVLRQAKPDDGRNSMPYLLTGSPDWMRTRNDLPVREETKHLAHCYH